MRATDTRSDKAIEADLPCHLRPAIRSIAARLLGRYSFGRSSLTAFRCTGLRRSTASKYSLSSVWRSVKLTNVGSVQTIPQASHDGQSQKPPRSEEADHNKWRGGTSVSFIKTVLAPHCNLIPHHKDMTTRRRASQGVAPPKFSMLETHARRAIPMPPLYNMQPKGT
ncbi:hypothetical protein GLAREA_01454 [Glarea lozoyensis ATCC 20868]|uniref:Uncharacterized protein n=1 Tax=Glarea lozoyensis (strain ATCC 20868 / MF5171) TaxID=1116229 RepID=S3CG92_GLAL2|nr:uncharacterized protein GLAREA_01454 [Glarea lozoyensis ATCC 20868]EPE25542.1 hypothetical protein GLAREA_01454 [Glarea lozoyensis ATCC 20868]